MRKLLSVVLAVFCFGLLFSIPVSADNAKLNAESESGVVSQKTYYDENGFKYVETIEKDLSMAALAAPRAYAVIVAYKTISCYGTNDEIRYSVTAKGQFYYEYGVMVMAISDSSSYTDTIFDDWFLKSFASTYLGNYVTAIATFKCIEPVTGLELCTDTLEVTVYCDRYGNIS